MAVKRQLLKALNGGIFCPCTGDEFVIIPSHVRVDRVIPKSSEFIKRCKCPQDRTLDHLAVFELVPNRHVQQISLRSVIRSRVPNVMYVLVIDVNAEKCENAEDRCVCSVVSMDDITDTSIVPRYFGRFGPF